MCSVNSTHAQLNIVQAVRNIKDAQEVRRLKYYATSKMIYECRFMCVHNWMLNGTETYR